MQHYRVEVVSPVAIVYWHFVTNSAHIAAPLNIKLRKGVPRTIETLKQDKYEALVTLQDKLVSTAVLEVRRTKGHFTLDMDVQEKQGGCALMKN